MGSSFRMRVARWRDTYERVWTNRKREVFFGCVATFALSQVFYREYLLRQRKTEQNNSTPQAKHRTKVVQITEQSVNPYGIRSEWKR
jgi:hypothetical protein